MNINNILKNVDIIAVRNFNEKLDILSVHDNSSNVTVNSIFVCIRGLKFDGHNYAKAAIKNGAIALIVEEFIDDIEITQIKCCNNRKVLAICCNNFYSDLLKKLRLIGVTGTNGKTTITYMLQTILKNDYNVGIIGTTGVIYNNHNIETKLTTPDCLELYKIFEIMFNDGVNVIIMEISAHAIALYKVFGLEFEIGIFTNLTQDHLDFFGDMESYYSVKAGFIMDQCNNKIINVDDNYGRQLYTIACNPKFSYAINSPADIFAIDIVNTKYGSKFVINAKDEIYEIECKIANDYNVSNCLASIYAGRLLGVSMSNCAKFLTELKTIPGRMKILKGKGFDVVIDYAHTPDGLEKLLTNLKKFNYTNIITIFGSCGYRDSLKRPIMGRVVSRLSDYCYITNDNPRFENPMDIANAIAEGCERKNYEIELDRKIAISKAFEKVSKGGVVVCCGKSTDKYQDIRGEKFKYNEIEIVNELISKFIK